MAGSEQILFLTASNFLENSKIKIVLEEFSTEVKGTTWAVWWSCSQSVTLVTLCLKILLKSTQSSPTQRSEVHHHKDSRWWQEWPVPAGCSQFECSQDRMAIRCWSNVIKSPSCWGGPIQLQPWLLFSAVWTEKNPFRALHRYWMIFLNIYF